MRYSLSCLLKVVGFFALGAQNRAASLIISEPESSTTLIQRPSIRHVQLISIATTLTLRSTLMLSPGLAVVQSVEALRYKLEGRGFDSRWGSFRFFTDLIILLAAL